MPRLIRSAAERFWTHVQTSDDCWIWTGSRDKQGYGLFSIEVGRWSIRAHRYAYEHLIGPIPVGKVLDHIECDNPSCVNPSHLEPVTNRSNVIRGTGPTALNHRKTHCVNGHALFGDNVGIRKNGSRACKTCVRIRTKDLYWRKRQ